MFDNNLPFIYLGMSIGDISRRFELWKVVIEKIRKKSTRWKEKYLSFAGRVCLLKYVITTLLLYFMSFFKMPSRVQREI